jgi:hypothetical protein
MDICKAVLTFGDGRDKPVILYGMFMGEDKRFRLVSGLAVETRTFPAVR